VAERAALGLASLLRERIGSEKRVQTELIGPVPSFFNRVGGTYRWQIILRGPEPTAIVRGMRGLDGWRVETQPVSLL
jgi:primosomal protein N' (replication factor Y)